LYMIFMLEMGLLLLKKFAREKFKRSTYTFRGVFLLRYPCAVATLQQ
jgi:hypothetical protein